MASLLAVAACPAFLSVGSRDAGDQGLLDGGDAGVDGGPCFSDGGYLTRGATDPADSSLCCNPDVQASNGWVRRFNPTLYLVTPDTGGASSPTSVVVGNFLGHGNADLAVAATGSHYLYVLGNVGGVFTDAGAYALGGGGADDIPGPLAAADLNGDGVTDLVSVNGRNVSSYSTFLSQPNGGFVVTTHPLAGDPVFAALTPAGSEAGRFDLAAALYRSGRIAILAGDGQGGFAAPRFAQAGSEPDGVVLMDFDGDGVLDMAETNQDNNDNTIRILKGNIDGGFSEVERHPGSGALTHGGLDWIAAGDLDGDGNVDLIATNYYSGTLCLLLGNGNGTFSEHYQELGIGYGPSSALFIDIDGDGSKELVVTQQDLSSVSLFHWDRVSRTVVPWFEVTGIDAPKSLAAVPRKDSAALDLAMVNNLSDTVTVLVNGCP